LRTVQKARRAIPLAQRIGRRLFGPLRAERIACSIIG
jgi:hypothetical protein